MFFHPDSSCPDDCFILPAYAGKMKHFDAFKNVHVTFVKLKLYHLLLNKKLLKNMLFLLVYGLFISDKHSLSYSLVKLSVPSCPVFPYPND